MKNRKLLMQVKAYTNNLLFSGCKWSMLITAYALIAIIIVMSSESYFSEGVYAAEIAYSTEAYDFLGQNDVLCMGKAVKESDDIEMTDTETSALSSKAFEENYAKTVECGLNTSNQVNVNIMDSIANDRTVTLVHKEKRNTKKNKDSKESVQAFKNGDNAKIELSATEKNILMRIVEAEATGEDITGKMLVANVVLNRVNNSSFPDTVEGVVFQKNGSVYQFSPIKDGRYYKVEISDETKKAVKRVLNGEDKSEGALYFMSRSMAKASSVTWFDRSLTRVFKHGTHEFYK
nr:cell wall hydrolase [uncultured Lachnoclostridium sp.]